GRWALRTDVPKAGGAQLRFSDTEYAAAVAALPLAEMRDATGRPCLPRRDTKADGVPVGAHLRDAARRRNGVPYASLGAETAEALRAKGLGEFLEPLARGRWALRTDVPKAGGAQLRFSDTEYAAAVAALPVAEMRDTTGRPCLPRRDTKADGVPVGAHLRDAARRRNGAPGARIGRETAEALRAKGLGEYLVPVSEGMWALEIHARRSPLPKAGDDRDRRPRVRERSEGAGRAGNARVRTPVASGTR
ncbi:hypothetical protein ACIPPJ_33400, partial [Streptomyces sp. NPDC086091]|uniref:hypothetical protein n=1 Tax=Streptomyces sp. NPDC086091 TaxID=3365751 RepID=UPI00380AB3E7